MVVNTTSLMIYAKMRDVFTTYIFVIIQRYLHGLLFCTGGYKLLNIKYI